MRLRPTRSGTLVGLALLLMWVPRAASAQSIIGGLVTDATGAVLPGVTVEASSPALIEKLRTVVTDAGGRYTIVDIRPGVYTVTFTLPGFSTVKREGIEVASNVSVPLNAQLKVGAVAETVTVSGSTPVVDVQQAAQREVLTREALDAFPSARVYYSTGAIVPGLKMTRPDMGGTASLGTEVYLLAHGKGQAENVFEVDGLDVRNARQDGNTQPTNFGIVQEVTYQTSAIGAVSQPGLVLVLFHDDDLG